MIRRGALLCRCDKSYYYVVVHGYHGIVSDYEDFDDSHKGRISSKLVNKIKNSKKQKVWLVSCESALTPPDWASPNTTKVSFAQRLANQTGKKVKAPNVTVHFNLYTHNSALDWSWGGKWIWHYPQ